MVRLGRLDVTACVRWVSDVIRVSSGESKSLWRQEIRRAGCGYIRGGKGLEGRSFFHIFSSSRLPSPFHKKRKIFEFLVLSLKLC